MKLFHILCFAFVLVINASCKELTTTPENKITKPTVTAINTLNVVFTESPMISTPSSNFVTVAEITGWKKYIHTESGVSFEYPENCLVPLVGDTVHFRCNDIALYGLLDIQKLTPEEAETIMNPLVFKEGDGFIILWQRPIRSPDFLGWEYIVSHFPEPIVTPSADADLSKYFNITYIDKMKQMRFSFFTSFDYESLQLAKELGFDEVVSSRYSVFEYMASSLKYDK